MDRNQIIGLVVMLVFITVYFQFFAPEPAAIQADNTEQYSDSTAQTSSVAATSNKPYPIG